MTVTSPSVEVLFKQLASSAVTRSQNGYAILIVRDDTTTTLTDWTQYTDISDVKASDYTAENYQYIEDVFVSSPYKVCVARIATTDANFSDALAIIRANVGEGWITVADGTDSDFTTLDSWVNSMNANGFYYNAVVYKATTAPNSMYVVNFVNDNVYFSDTTRGKQSGLTYLASLSGILAKANIDQGTDYYICTNLSKVDEVADNSTALASGQFILINDGSYVRICRGINSLITTNGSTLTEDMKEILVVQVMQQIQQDIISTFKTSYLGQHKNKYDDQMLFVSSINSYFKSLATEDVLDEDYDNVVSIDVNAQRNAWISTGTDVSKLIDAQIKQKSYKRSVFLAGDIKILQSMTNLSFTINLD